MNDMPAPKVTLISWTNKPLQTIHAMTQNMFGERILNLDAVKMEDCLETIAQIKKTSLQAPLEFVDLNFQIENVPRALTHQIVRTRVGAVYSQESLRFACKTDGFEFDVGDSVKTLEQKAAYYAGMEQIQEVYNDLIELGVETQDARGILPINVLTNIGVKYNLMTLKKVAEVRLCYQSQPHWKSVIQQMKDEVADKIHPALANLLLPYCDAHGKCGYESMYDRKCPKQKQFKPETAMDIANAMDGKSDGRHC